MYETLQFQLGMRKPKGKAGSKPASRVRKCSFKTRPRKVSTKHNAPKGSSRRITRLRKGTKVVPSETKEKKQQNGNMTTKLDKTALKSAVVSLQKCAVSDAGETTADLEPDVKNVNAVRRRSNRILAQIDTDVSSTFYY